MLFASSPRKFSPSHSSAGILGKEYALTIVMCRASIFKRYFSAVAVSKSHQNPLVRRSHISRKIFFNNTLLTIH